MGAVCCIAARDRNLNHASSSEIAHRNIRPSASWSLRWDSRVGVAGEEASVGWMSDVASRNDVLDVKSATDVSAQVSDGGSSLESYQTSTWRKSPPTHQSGESIRSLASDQSIARNTPTEVKTESPQVSISASSKQSLSVHATSSMCVSPLSSQSYPLPPSPTSSRMLAPGSPVHFLPPQRSYIQSSGMNSPNGMSVASNETTRGSFGRFSDGWSAHAFSDLRSTSQRERFSFDSDSCSFAQDKSSRASCLNSGLVSIDFPKCGICSKLMSEKSAWSSQKIGGGNELAVAAVLICEHVYHAECLEMITPETNKYDPACPVCTFGARETLKLTGKMLKAEKHFKAKNSKKFRNRGRDHDRSFHFDYWKSSPLEIEKSPKLMNSSSLKISSAKPFLKRHFSFGSRSSKPASESPSLRKKGLFWAKSSRV